MHEGYAHLLVAVDKFSKWIEARLITKIKSEQAMLFFHDIIHRFGVPNSIITNNMPFFMVYCAEAILPTDLDYRAPRVMMYKELEVREFLKDALDQLDKARDVALLHSSKY
jgi:hypothetical protein